MKTPVSPKIWKGVVAGSIILLAVIILLASMINDVEANNPRWTYSEQPKYSWVFCKVLGIPKNRCHGKKP